MARDFSKNTANIMELGVGGLADLITGAAKISVHCWAIADSFSVGTNENRLLTVSINTGATGLTFLATNPAGTVNLRCGARSLSTDGFQAVNNTSALSTGVLYSLGAVFNIVGDIISPYFNGSIENSTSVTFGGAAWTVASDDGDSIGKATGVGSPASSAVQWDGRISEMAVWVDDIGASGYASLAKGFSPLMVRPDALIFYMPLFGNGSPERDIISGRSGTISGTVAKADHPRIIYPSASQIRGFGSVAPATSVKDIIGSGFIPFAR